MALYFGHASTGAISETVSPALQDQGISMLRAQPQDVNIVVLTISDQPGYACYLRNLPAYMEATAMKRVCAIRGGGFPVREPASVLPWKLPPLTYTFDKPPSDVKIEKMKTHSTIIGVGKNLQFVHDRRTVEL